MSGIAIGDLAREVGVATSTIRYYESIGLLAQAERRSGRRVYSTDAVARVQLVRWATEVGFSLREIADLLSRLETTDLPSREWQRAANERLGVIDKQIEALHESRKRVSELAECACQTLGECESRILSRC